ncbi:MAG: SPOR domain-containing protein [Gemmatimonadaceae bacterium]|jgi:hypothetical protein|nr:SPOR domain-containing protein [Gemmatimonadaceae bacterium]
MTSATPATPLSAESLWVAQAQQAVPALASWGAAVIAARDAQVAGTVAVAIARALAETRRVAIADLVGDLPALTALVPPMDEDAHGVADSFRYGVSLNRIARPVDDAGSLFVLPSGTEAVAHEEIYRNERWRRLAGGFTQVGASLLVVASPEVPGFDELVRYVGGLVRVGDQAPAAPADVAQSLTIETPEPLAKAAARATDRARRTASARPEERRSRTLALVAVAAAVVLGVIFAWPIVRAQLRGARTDDAPPAAETRSDAGRVATAPAIAAPVSTVADTATAPDSAVTDTTRADVDSMFRAIPAIGNPADSARAARYAVYVLAANTASSAVPAVERAARTAGVGDSALTGLAVSPVTFGQDGARWYRVTMGAFATRADAESLLVQLRRSNVLGETSGSVITVPLAFELERDLPAAATRAALSAWRARGVRPYVLRSANGSARIYTGAFESPEQAALFADSLRTLGFTPPLAFRIGRSSP